MGESRTGPPRETGGEGTESRTAAGAAFADTRQTEFAVALAALIIAGAIFTWWGREQGAYFGNVFFPGAITIFALLILLLAAAPFGVRLAGPAAVALGALVGLGLWMLISIAWTSSQDAGLQSAGHALLYAALFAVGLWSCTLSAGRRLLPLAAVAAVGGLVGIATLFTLANGTDLATYVHEDATLRFPIGYRNADAAFFLICLWPAVALGAYQRTPWPARILLLGTAAMLVELTIVCQSRGSLPAAVVGLAVMLAVAPRRLRLATHLGIVALPVLFALPALLDPYQYGAADAALLPLLRDAAAAIAISSLGAIALAALCIVGIEPRLNLGEQRIRVISRALAAISTVLIVVGGVVFVSERGGPTAFIDQRLGEFRLGETPDLQAQGTRFGVNIGTNRGDFWRVALDRGGERPLHGGGAGSYGNTYLLERQSVETPKDPHSVELLMLSELGIVGLLLFAAFLVGAAWAAVRSRRAASPASLLVAGALGSGAYWLAHASYDWFWNYPALTGVAIFLLGAAAAPGLARASEVRPGSAAVKRDRNLRLIALAATALAMLTAVPLFLSQRYANRAYEHWGADPAGALDDLERAAALNPFDPRPLLAKGVIETRTGRESEAIASYREAAGREPEGYAAHLFLAKALADSDPAAARAEAREALRLNPFDPEVRALARG